MTFTPWKAGIYLRELEVGGRVIFFLEGASGWLAAMCRATSFDV